MTVGIYATMSGYTLRKIESESYGYYETIEEAEEVKKELEKVNWDKNRLQEIREKVGVSKIPKYYHRAKTPNGIVYKVMKKVNGKVEYYGRYKDEDTAKKIVEELKKVDWNKELLPRIKEKIQQNGA